MASDVRARMIAGAARLLAQGGLHGTSFADVLELTGAPRGSLYHHFPGGKDELIGAAIELVGSRSLDALEQRAGAPPDEIAAHFLDMWRSLLSRSHLTAGCSVLAVTVASPSRVLLERTGEIFRTWRGRLAQLLEQGGLTATEAARFAATLIAASEGAVVLSRAEQSMEPFELVCEQLMDQIRRIVSTR